MRAGARAGAARSTPVSGLPFGPSTLAPEPVRAVLFDLDGTLLDTAEDIGVALNRALAEQQSGPLELARVRDLIGRGAPVLVQRVIAGLYPRPWPVDPVLLLQRFYYHYDLMHETHEYRARPYPGVEEGLAQLHTQGLRIGVVTNKPRLIAAALLVHLRLSQWIDLVVGGDTAEQRKPHPQPLLHACEALQVSVSEALMVGDSATDVLAARAAGLRIVCVPYGYNEGADPRALPCDAFIDSIAELPRLLFEASLTRTAAANDALAHSGK
jgi:phosphoglycolate phosphatase